MGDMKKLVLIYLLILFCIPATSSIAQTREGSVVGIVRDEQGGAVPGSAVSIKGPDATFEFTSESTGAFRFLNLQPGQYLVSASLDGFTTATREVIVATGKQIDIALTLRVAGVAETVTVAAPAPMIDAKATGTSTTFASAELTNIPTSRDVFSLVRTVPGVLLDRVNVGGNETGQAPTIVSKGTRPQDTVSPLAA